MKLLVEFNLNPSDELYDVPDMCAGIDRAVSSYLASCEASWDKVKVERLLDLSKEPAPTTKEVDYLVITRDNCGGLFIDVRREENSSQLSYEAEGNTIKITVDRVRGLSVNSSYHGMQIGSGFILNGFSPTNHIGLKL